MILTVNSGSTSVKLAAFETGDTRCALQRLESAQHSGSNLAANELLQDFINALQAATPIEAVVHRVVHGGMRYTQPIRIDESVLAELEALKDLAPLHNPPALRWIEMARAVCKPPTMHVAVFDTAFFAQLPPVAAHYAVPESMGAAVGVRRYGFHGIAHEAMWRRWCELNPRLPDGGRLISLQLGGGCSIAATARGRPLDVSMGFSPLEGLVMATRSGDIDPAVIPYLEKRLGLSSEEVIAKLNHDCGLKGLSGVSSDVSELIAKPSPNGELALDLYAYRARKLIGAYLAVLGGCDGIVFGGGVGEHVPQMRERILRGMEWVGIELDLKANAGAQSGEAQINSPASRVQVRVLPADEALSLARAVLAFKDSSK